MCKCLQVLIMVGTPWSLSATLNIVRLAGISNRNSESFQVTHKVLKNADCPHTFSFCRPVCGLESFNELSCGDSNEGVGGPQLKVRVQQLQNPSPATS